MNGRWADQAGNWCGGGRIRQQIVKADINAMAWKNSGVE